MNRNLLRFLAGAVLALAVAAVRAAGVGAVTAIPHLEKRGTATQLIVDGQPYLILGGETANTASSSPEYMATVWPRLAKIGLNTALVGVAWDWIEPEEGRFDFTLVDAMLQQARAQHLRIVIVWFGSWKNGLSSFAPAWVKRNQERFPRVRIASGKSVEILSVFSLPTCHADARAFAALLRHVREVDPQHTVIMAQLENEVGILGDSRDRSVAAEAAFRQPVPPELIDRLKEGTDLGPIGERRADLKPGELTRHAGIPVNPELWHHWAAAGRAPQGDWQRVFGDSPKTDEIFQAWHYAKYLDFVAAAGKAELAIPLFTNTWIVQPEDKGPGDYPSGGPEPLTIDIWRVGAPQIDLNCPDIYLPNFAEWCTRFHRPDNPLFVPESRGDAGGVANAFYAIGAHAALGYSPFGIDNLGRLLALRADPGATAPAEIETLPLPRGYALLRQLTPLILAAQAKGTIAAVVLNADHPTEDVVLGNYVLNVDLRRNRRAPNQVPALGYAMLFNTGPDEYFVAGSDVQVTFSTHPANDEIVGFASAEAGEFVNGAWKPGRRMNGDDILLRYDLAAAAEKNLSGSGLRFFGPNPTVQHVLLYRYR